MKELAVLLRLRQIFSSTWKIPVKTWPFTAVTLFRLSLILLILSGRTIALLSKTVIQRRLAPLSSNLLLTRWTRCRQWTSRSFRSVVKFNQSFSRGASFKLGTLILLRCNSLSAPIVGWRRRMKFRLRRLLSSLIAKQRRFTRVTL